VLPAKAAESVRNAALNPYYRMRIMLPSGISYKNAPHFLQLFQKRQHYKKERCVFMENNSKTRIHLRALVESALLLALGFILSYFRLGVPWVQGGSVTPLSMLPIMIIGLRHGLKWGLGSGFVYACLQMLQSFYPPPTGTVEGYIAVVMLDYIVAFSVLGLSGLFKGKKFGLVYAAPVCLILRFLSHFTSGIIIWGIYADDLPVWLFSLIYNGSYMGPELVLTLVTGAILCSTAPFLFTVTPSETTSVEQSPD